MRRGAIGGMIAGMIDVRAFLLIAAMLASGVTQPALACTPPPAGAAPRAADRAQLAEAQKTLWDQSSEIFVVRVEATRPVRLAYDTPSREVRLLPLRWLKGEGVPRAFWMGRFNVTSCGAIGGGDAIDGEVGERFVVFAGGDGFRPNQVRHSVGAASAVDARVRAALASVK